MPQEKLPNEALGIDGPERLPPACFEAPGVRHPAIIER